MFNYVDPEYVAREGFFNFVSPLTLATSGFLSPFNTTTAKFCLYLLLRAEREKCVSYRPIKPAIEVQGRVGPSITLMRSLKPEVNLFRALSVKVEVRYSKKPLITTFIDNCEDD